MRDAFAKEMTNLAKEMNEIVLLSGYMDIVPELLIVNVPVALRM